MKKKLAKFLDKLSRDEMRTIVGGYGGCTIRKYYDPGYGSYVFLEVESGVIRNLLGSKIGQMPYSGTCPS